MTPPPPERQQATVDRLADTFGIRRAPTRPGVVPGAPPTLEQRVVNLDEMADIVIRTRYARFLDPAPAAGARRTG